MKPALPLLLCAALAACGKSASPSTDAGVVDDSCGIDCEAQARYGLLLDRCFEYSDSSSPADPADLGVLVRRLTTLEGDVKTLQVEYTRSGQILATDFFTLQSGSLYLVRRTVAGGERVQYQDETGALTGVPWVHANTAAGQSFTTDATAGLLSNDNVTTEPTRFKVTATTPDPATELTVPLQTFEEGVKLVFDETPDHGLDRRRVLVPGTGFVAFATGFTLDPQNQTLYRLQKVRDVGADAGTTLDCGFGSP